MPHIVFFSYARKDVDRYLENFFKDLCAEIAVFTDYSPEDTEVSFRDKSDLVVMENWRSNIVGALQSSAVLVCITSKKYFSRDFCGKEFYVFDKRRRQGLGAGQLAPPVILPVVWAPAGGLPAAMNEVQQVPKDVPDSYLEKGLREIAKFDQAVYERCVTSFAKAIVAAADKYGKKLKTLEKVPDFENIPNAFAGGTWEDAVGPDGAWLSGPEVANFVFVAQSNDTGDDPKGRYGADAAEWRPYFPDKTETVLDHATRAIKKQFRFREIRVNNDLPGELDQAKKRKNLSILIGDPGALILDRFKEVRAIEQLWWEGSAVFLPCHEAVAKLDEDEAAFKETFPVISQVQSPNVRRPRTPAELQAALDATLFEMRRAVTQPEIDALGKTDAPPPGLSGTGVARS